jgi:hypothetical protein
VANDSLKIPKIKRQVSMWVHPEGQVIGSLFLRTQSVNHAGVEEPIEVLNKDKAFIVLDKEEPGQIRFYNRNAIIRVEYEEETKPFAEAEQKIIPCQLTMMDGALFNGEIRETLAPDRARLFDYLNHGKARFLKLYTDTNQVCLVNKSYIINVATESSDT